METIDFNINHHVLVKLTDLGRSILEAQHDLLYKELGINEPYKPRKEVDGWSKWQMWVLMETFGESISMSGKPAFETNIKIEVKE